MRGPRWPTYAACLRAALDAGYRVVSLESWLGEQCESRERTVVLRHDVDADAAGARRMSDIERDLGLCSTFYFRWSTLDLRVVESVRRNGSHIGFHYETLTRYALEQHLSSPAAITEDVLEASRRILKEEIARFRDLVGECRSVAAHGDLRARLIGRTNDCLLAGERYSDYGILYSADDPSVLNHVDGWVADDDGSDGYRRAGVRFQQALEGRHAVLLFNSHPNHWGAGLPLLAKRLLTNVDFVLRRPAIRQWGRAEQYAWQRFCLRLPEARGSR